MFSQIWLPIALNFSMGLYFVSVTALMLFVTKRRAKLQNIDPNKETLIEKKNESKTVFKSCGMKERLLRILILIGIGIGAVYAILLVMDIDFVWLVTNLKYDLLNEDIYNKH